MKKIFWIPFLLMALIGNLSAAPAENNALFREANDLYGQGDYNRSAELYQKIIDSGWHSAEVYFNLGNAFYRLGNLSHAILNYERAERLDPSDPEISRNLNIARSLLADEVLPMPEPFSRKVFRFLFSDFSIQSLGLWAFILGVGMALCFIVYLFSGRSMIKKVSFSGFVVFLVFSVAFYAGFRYEKNYRASQSEAIITSASVYVKNGPSPASGNAFILHEGTKAVWLETVNDWGKIRLADGKTGWIPVTDMEKI